MIKPPTSKKSIVLSPLKLETGTRCRNYSGVSVDDHRGLHFFFFDHESSLNYWRNPKQGFLSQNKFTFVVVIRVKLN